MPQLLNNIEEATHPKVDSSLYIRTENTPDEDSDTQNPVQPAQPEAE